MDRPTFSQAWSRVSRLTPSLRPQVQIHRQLYRGEPWHIVHDPVSNNFFRLNPVAYHLVGLLDGRRSVDDVWRATLERHGDAAPTQNEVIGLLGQLNESNLIRVDLPPDAAPLLKRARTRKLREWGGQLMNIFSLRFPIFNPNRMLEWLSPLFRPILSKWGMILWTIWIAICLAIFIPHVSEFSRNAENVLAPANWGWMILMFILVKAWHELGHGLVCKRFGGSVPEVGIMMLVLFPAPYVDATSSWNFPNKWQRLVVGAAGMIFELSIAGLAAVIWVNSDDGLTKQLAYNVVFLASVTTLLFNGNPLLRFDGYYILSDLLEVPNLYDRGTRQLCWYWLYYAFGLENSQVVSTLPGESAVLVIYGILSRIYVFIIMFSIALFIANKIPVIGAIIGIWSIVSFALIPTGKFIHWLATAPELYKHRFRAVAVTVVAFVLVAGPLGLYPAKDHRRAEGVIESADRADVAAATDGFVTQVLVEAGDRVQAGQVILIAQSPELLTQQKEDEAQVRRLEIAQRQALSQDAVDMQMNRAKLNASRKDLADVTRRLNELTIRAPQSGVLTGGTMSQLTGQFLHRGQVIARVEDPSNLRVTAVMDQAVNASGFFDQISKIELRTVSETDRVIPSHLIQIIGSGQTRLPNPALGYQGGGTIPTAPEDRKGLTAMRPLFTFWLELPPQPDKNKVLHPAGSPGERVYVRFTLETRRPLLFQWVHRLRQVVRDRLSV